VKAPRSGRCGCTRYYAGLLFTRQMDDDRICKAKYGALWDAYTKKVKYRIIPFIY
jgi:delta14-sterol reductase